MFFAPLAARSTASTFLFHSTVPTTCHNSRPPHAGMRALDKRGPHERPSSAKRAKHESDSDSRDFRGGLKSSDGLVVRFDAP